jgi:hypothetical protein
MIPPITVQPGHSTHRIAPRHHDDGSSSAAREHQRVSEQPSCSRRAVGGLVTSPSCGRRACVSDEGQFPKPLAELLFAGRRAAQCQLGGLGDALHPEAVRRPVKGPSLRLASRSAKWVKVIVHGVALSLAARSTMAVAASVVLGAAVSVASAAWQPSLSSRHDRHRRGGRSYLLQDADKCQADRDDGADQKAGRHQLATHVCDP